MFMITVYILERRMIEMTLLTHSLLASVRMTKQCCSVNKWPLSAKGKYAGGGFPSSAVIISRFHISPSASLQPIIVTAAEIRPSARHSDYRARLKDDPQVV